MKSRLRVIVDCDTIYGLPVLKGAPGSGDFKTEAVGWLALLIVVEPGWLDPLTIGTRAKLLALLPESDRASYLNMLSYFSGSGLLRSEAGIQIQLPVSLSTSTRFMGISMWPGNVLRFSQTKAA